MGAQLAGACCSEASSLGIEAEGATAALGEARAELAQWVQAAVRELEELKTALGRACEERDAAEARAEAAEAAEDAVSRQLAHLDAASSAARAEAAAVRAAAERDTAEIGAARALAAGAAAAIAEAQARATAAERQAHLAKLEAIAAANAVASPVAVKAEWAALRADLDATRQRCVLLLVSWLLP